MNVIFVADIGDHGHSDFGQNLGGDGLRLPQLRPIAVAGFFGNLFQRTLFVLVPRRELDSEEGETPAPNPAANS